MKNQHETPEALAHALFTAAQLAPGEGIEDAVGRLAALVEAHQHARIAELEAQLASIGAGGVTGPLIGQPQAMPDLSQLTERGAKAWVGVDAQGLREGGADMSKEREAFERALTELAARYDEAIRPSDFSRDDTGAYHNGMTDITWMLWQARASLQSPGFTAADMATAESRGFRDGVASLAASAGEPVAIRPDIQAVLAMLDVPVIARMSSHEGKLLKLGQEPPAFESAVPLVREWDHRRACETIIAALSGRMTKENK